MTLRGFSQYVGTLTRPCNGTAQKPLLCNGCVECPLTRPVTVLLKNRYRVMGAWNVP